MTITRTYFESLIELFEQLTPLSPMEFRKYIGIKEKINQVVSSVLKFNLFPLTFSPEFIGLLTEEKDSDFLVEKLLLVNELNYELYECLDVKRLRYGGELLKYLNRFQIALLDLSLNEYIDLYKNLKTTGTFKNQMISFNSEVEKSMYQASLRRIPHNQLMFPDKTIIRKKDYRIVEERLKERIQSYEAYIFGNYSSMAHHFQFYHRKIRGYLCKAMSKEEYEFRLYSYEATDGDRSIQVAQQYYDMCGTYFCNLEETSERQIIGMVSGLNKQEMSLKHLLDKPFVHHELIDVFLRNSSEIEIALFIAFLLRCEGYRVKENFGTQQTYDLLALKNDDSLVIEIFHKQPRSIQIVERKITQLTNYIHEGKPTFIFTSFPGDDVIDILEASSIKVMHLHHLYHNHFLSENSDILHWYILSRLPQISLQTTLPSIAFQGEQLIKKLERCIPGDAEWSAYEKIGEEIFHFLFADNFKTYLVKSQASNHAGNHRRDLIVNNNFKQVNSFWADVKTSYNAQVIIVDFKNYKKPLDSTNFFNVSKYTNKGVSGFAIVFSRKGIDDTARIEQKCLYHSGKLLIEFSDHELIQMIREKIIGKDPVDRLDSKKFSLIKSI